MARKSAPPPRMPAKQAAMPAMHMMPDKTMMPDKAMPHPGMAKVAAAAHKKYPTMGKKGGK